MVFISGQFSAICNTLTNQRNRSNNLLDLIHELRLIINNPTFSQTDVNINILNSHNMFMTSVEITGYSIKFSHKLSTIDAVDTHLLNTLYYGDMSAINKMISELITDGNFESMINNSSYDIDNYNRPILYICIGHNPINVFDYLIECGLKTENIILTLNLSIYSNELTFMDVMREINRGYVIDHILNYIVCNR